MKNKAQNVKDYRSPVWLPPCTVAAIQIIILIRLVLTVCVVETDSIRAVEKKAREEVSQGRRSE